MRNKLAIENRIALLESRQKENYNIVRQLKSELIKLNNN